jgi:hypothetical protein
MGIFTKNGSFEWIFRDFEVKFEKIQTKINKTGSVVTSGILSVGTRADGYFFGTNWNWMKLEMCYVCGFAALRTKKERDRWMISIFKAFKDLT